MKVLVLGADGFIGRHIAFQLRAAGHNVLASARRTKALEQMGFSTLQADLSDPAAHDPAFWRTALAGNVHLINAAGILLGSAARFGAVHVAAPRAAYRALDGGQGVLISAVGIDTADTPFAHWRREGEAAARADGRVTILRPGLVLADTSYGGSSLLRALAAMPFFMPVVGSGAQKFNPVHASDLAAIAMACLITPPVQAPIDVGGAEVVSQTELIGSYRRWLGLPTAKTLHLPLWVARLMGRVGDWLQLGPISATAVAQLEAGVLARPTTLSPPARGIGNFLAARPAGTQDLWQARLYLMKPAIRLVLALMWLVSGAQGLALPDSTFLQLFPASSLGDRALTLLARGGGLIDLALGFALIANLRPKAVGWAQFAMVAGYTIGLSLLAPQEWLAPLGGLLKNLPVLALIATHIALSEER